MPFEPTPKMLAATWDHEIDKSGGIESQNTRNARIWSAMLAAAPSSLAGGEALDRFERAAFAQVQNLPRGTASRTEEIARRDAEYDAARNAILAALSPEAPRDLKTVCQRMADDYQTSDAHHPQHVLVGRADFETMVAALATREEAPAVPDDVRRLVEAARVVAFEDQGHDALKALDVASEAFADRVPWENEPSEEAPALENPDEPSAPENARDWEDTAEEGEIGAEYDAAGHCVTLAECPPGLFLYNGTLGFKSEYGAMEPDDAMNGKHWKVGNRADAYCADSGEYFWGGTSNHDDRAKLLVYPIAAETVAMVASHGPSALRAQPQAREDAQPVDHWSDCAVHNAPAYPVGSCDCGGYIHPAPDALRDALADLASWFTKPVQGQNGMVWVIPAGEMGADDAVNAALAALQAEQKGGAA